MESWKDAPAPRRAARVSDYATALACYRSPEYQGARPLRLANSTGDFVIVEGYDGPQPPQLASRPAAAARRGYWIGHVDITDPEGYKAYMAANAAPFGKFAGASWCAAAHARSLKARSAAAPWCWNSRATMRRSAAIGRRTIRRRNGCATARRIGPHRRRGL